MIKATLTRLETGDDGTFGKLVFPGLLELWIVELPWRDLNCDGVGDPMRSCVTAGTYKCDHEESPTRKDKDGQPEKTYRLKNVKGRDGILIHAANFAGDVEKGYVSEVLGCLGPGLAIIENMDLPARLRTAKRSKQKGVSSSVKALKLLEDTLERESFELTIRWAPGVGPSHQGTA